MSVTLIGDAVTDLRRQQGCGPVWQSGHAYCTAMYRRSAACRKPVFCGATTLQHPSGY